MKKVLWIVGGVVGIILLVILGNALKPKVPKNIGGGGSIYNNYTLNVRTIRSVVSNTRVLSSTPSRTYALFVNDSANAIYLNLSSDGTVADDYTVRLNANGGSYEILPENMYSGDVFASSSAASNLSITEGI